MRIIAGTARGTRLAPVPESVRPTSERVRESGERGRTAAIVALVVGYIELACVVFFIIMYFVYMGSTGWTDV